MAKKKLLPIISLILLFTLVFGFHLLALDKKDIQEIQQAIKAKGANWTPGENWVTQLSREEQKKLCGELSEKPDPADVNFIELPMRNDMPPSFDWRNNNGNWVTPVTNQGGGCGSCWDFSAVAQVEAWWKIYNANLDSMIDLSEQFVLSCSDGSCSGWSTALALKFIRENGVPLETCMPYQADDTIPCGNACSDWQSQAITFPGWGYITLDEPIVENIKNAVYLHPVSVSFDVYQDFYSYTGGVYQHVYGDYDGGHAVLIVGWEDENECWIIKNSWGPAWGDHGYFRIKWGDSGMGDYVPFIWDEVINEPSLQITQNKINLSLTIGDSVTENITLKNSGSKQLFYFAADYQIDFNFHVDDYNSYDGASWWCGDPELNGYNNHWLDYLDTPELNLSTTASPKLTCMVKWAMENPAGATDADPAYDGWDGCNVMISSDGGKTFEVLNPVTPAYNCQSLWSFGHPDQGWDFGPGIAGWGGLSSGWKPAEFDLTAYKSDQVVIRFALASDQAYCGLDDANLKGYFVDQIEVADGATVLFQNNGDDNGDMEVSGLSDQSIADWITLSQSAGTIPPNDSSKIGVTINTRDLSQGKYSGLIYLSSNDTTTGFLSVNLSMDLVKPQHDLAITQVWLPGENIPILFPVEPGAEISNEGLSDETNFSVICQVLDQGTLVYSDTALVSSQLAGETKIVTFKPLLVSESGELEFSITLENLVDDYNAYNNSFVTLTTVSNLVDGFETATGLWSFQGGWGITNSMQGYQSEYAAHVTGGNLPYPHNMDAYMTFLPGFDLSPVNKLTLKFWTRYITELNADICYVEASGDQVTWTKLDSLSGNHFSQWTQREVGLTNYITSGYEKVWVRFHFVSNASIAMAGLLIDQVEIYPQNPTDVAEKKETNIIPEEWQLSQNYPNPFNLGTNFLYNMPESGDVKLTIYNINGEVVRNLLQQKQSAGSHSIDWNGRDNNGNVVGSGVYLYKLEVKGKYVNSKKLILLK